MSEARKFRKGDKLESRPGFIYEVVGDESHGGKVRVKLIRQPPIDDTNRYPYSAAVATFSASALRGWGMVSEGPAKRPNNRVTKIKAVDIRLGETIRYEGETFLVNHKQGLKGVWLISEVGGRRISIDGTADVEVLGTRGRPLPKIVHFNQFTEPGLVKVQYNSRKGFGSGWCGVVADILVFASSQDLVTCEQNCGEKCREYHWKKGTK